MLRSITETLIVDSPMHLEQAVLYGIRAEGDFFELNSHVDVYHLLAHDYSNVESVIGVVVKISGWAVPLDPETGEEDGPPSQHSKRQRVVLVAALTIDGFCSAMKLFRPVPGAVLEETIFEEDLPSGKLWEALCDCFDKMQKVAR